ncbi:MAG: hypothetical protein GY946_33330 [bacterium]|nr:hypothetical protein [bacterium]
MAVLTEEDLLRDVSKRERVLAGVSGFVTTAAAAFLAWLVRPWSDAANPWGGLSLTILLVAVAIYGLDVAFRAWVRDVSKAKIFAGVAGAFRALLGLCAAALVLSLLAMVGASTLGQIWQRVSTPGSMDSTTILQLSLLFIGLLSAVLAIAWPLLLRPTKRKVNREELGLREDDFVIDVSQFKGFLHREPNPGPSWGPGELELTHRRRLNAAVPKIAWIAAAACTWSALTL